MPIHRFDYFQSTLKYEFLSATFKQMGRLFIPFGLLTYYLASFNIYWICLSLPLLAIAFLSAVKNGQAYQFFVFFLIGNLVVSLLSGIVVERDHFIALLGVDFAILFSLLAFLFSASFAKNISPLFSLRVIWLYLIFLCFYFMMGWIKGNGLPGAASYFRLYLYPFLFFLFGLVIRTERDRTDLIIKCFFMFFVLLFTFEFCFPENFYQLTGMANYFSHKMYFLTPEGLAERNMRWLFNFELFSELRIFRPMGPIGHAISSSYLFLFFALWFLLYKKYLYALVGLLICLLFGVKGSMLALGMIVCFEVLYRILNYFGMKVNRWLTWGILLTVLGYMIMAFLVGFKVGNPHMLNVAGALYHVPDNVFGGGLGFGGSQSRSIVEGPKFNDSVLATGLSQLGLVGIILVYTFYLALVRRVALLYLNDTKVRLAFFYCIALLANSVFQEEGFSPYALGLALFLLAYSVSSCLYGAASAYGSKPDPEAA